MKKDPDPQIVDVTGMLFEDRTLRCRDCRREFTYTAGEQRFFTARGYQPPSRCPEDRQKAREKRERDEAAGG